MLLVEPGRKLLVDDSVGKGGFHDRLEDITGGSFKKDHTERIIIVVGQRGFKQAGAISKKWNGCGSRSRIEHDLFKLVLMFLHPPFALWFRFGSHQIILATDPTFGKKQM